MKWKYFKHGCEVWVCCLLSVFVLPCIIAYDLLRTKEG